jgi:hypothetical protein
MLWTVATLPFATQPASRKAFRPSRRRRAALLDGPGSRRWEWVNGGATKPY